MKITTGRSALSTLLTRQLDQLFMLNSEEQAALEESMTAALNRTEFCFLAADNKYYHRDGQAVFDPYHTGQYCIFLYYLSHQCWQDGHQSVAGKVYALNKTLHAVDLFYEVALPDVFFCDHPVGSVMGRATYGNGFTFAQNCTVGHNKGVYPTIGENVQMSFGSAIIGECTIGNNVLLAAHCLIKDTDVPDDTIVFGQSPNLVFKDRPTAERG